jgi:peptide/nickel transport system ATP-binding protein
VKEKVLRVSGLTVQFEQENASKPFIAADRVSFEVEQGEILGIVGESGSGKTVTALSILRLLQQVPGAFQAGEITYFPQGKEPVKIDELNNKELLNYRGKHIAMIFQEPGASLNPVMTCGNQIIEMILLHTELSISEAKSKTLSLLKDVRLDEPERIFESYPHQMSGGQKQRVMIAMAMACKPSILIADEPTTALDVSTQKGILELMKALRDEHNTAIIFISHDLNLLSGFAEKAMVMKDGKVVEYGSVKDVFNNPSHPYTRGLLSCRPPLKSRLFRLPMLSDFLSGSGAGSGFDPNHPSNQILPEERQTRHKEIYAKLPLVQVRGLRVGYERKSGAFSSRKQNIHAVDEVSFDIYPGETLGLVGESGSGKTSLGRALIRLIDPEGGTIFFNGNDITNSSQNQLRNLRMSMQIVFQDPYQSLNPLLTAGNAVMEPMLVHRTSSTFEERKRKALEMFDKVHLPRRFFDRLPSTLSGGQRQRLCIARALILNPVFLICDEAVSALDVSVQAQIINLISELKRDMGFTCLFISHDISVVRYLSDRILVMKHGKIIDQGEADALCESPNSAYTKELLQAVPVGLIP